MSLLDEAGKVRKGEELDVMRIDAYMKSLCPELEGELEIRQFPGGASNLTYLLSYPQKDYILRRPPIGKKAKSAHDMRRESETIRALKGVYPYVPKVLGYASDPDIMEGDFYVMERIYGIIPRKDLPPELKLTPEEIRRLCINVIDKLIELHQVDYRAAGLEGLGKGEGYIRRQITGWSERFRQAHTPDVNDFERIMSWLSEKMPAKDMATCIIHNDFRFDNVVLNVDNPLQVIGVLDWEMATLGDPLMDLGNSLAYWIEADDDASMQMMRRQPTHLPGMLTRDEVVAYYAERTGWHVDNFDFYAVYGLFRLAVILQQIYFRFYHKQTSNPAFATFGQMANELERRCLKMIDISEL